MKVANKKSHFCCVSAMHVSFKNRIHQIYSCTITHLGFCLPSKLFKDSTIFLFYRSEQLQTNLIYSTFKEKKNKPKQQQKSPTKQHNKHWSSAWIKMIAILHKTAFFILKSMSPIKSPLLQIRYFKLHPNNQPNVVLHSSNTRGKLHIFQVSNSKALGWELSWLYTFSQ